MGTIKEGRGERRFFDAVREFRVTDVQIHAGAEDGTRLILTCVTGYATIYASEQVEALSSLGKGNGTGLDSRQTRLWEDPLWVQTTSEDNRSPPGALQEEEDDECEGDEV